MADIVVPTGWRDRLEALAGRRRESWAVAALVTVVVAGGLMLWSRGASPQVAPPALETAVSGPAAATPADTGEGATPAAGEQAAAGGRGTPTGTEASSVGPGTRAEVIFVHIAGAVRRPGLYRLPAGSRVADGIDAAKGPRVGADLDALNLAAVLTDGTKLDVLRRGEAAAVAPGAGAGPGASPSPGATAPIDLNSADQAALETIPGVGPVTATAILEYRDEIGAFQSFDQLLEVSGIGPATLESIRPYVTI